MTFKNLEFGPHPVMPGLMAQTFFPNGYGVSVVRFMSLMGGYGSYTSGENEWECAILKGTKKKWKLCYTTKLADDVIGHLTSRKVTELMGKIQRLRKKK